MSMEVLAPPAAVAKFVTAGRAARWAMPELRSTYLEDLDARISVINFRR
jgi:hypothetical protein